MLKLCSISGLKWKIPENKVWYCTIHGICENVCYWNFSNYSVSTNIDGCDDKYQIKYKRNIIWFSIEQIWYI